MHSGDDDCSKVVLSESVNRGWEHQFLRDLRGARWFASRWSPSKIDVNFGPLSTVQDTDLLV